MNETYSDTIVSYLTVLNDLKLNIRVSSSFICWGWWRWIELLFSPFCDLLFSQQTDEDGVESPCRVTEHIKFSLPCCCCVLPSMCRRFRISAKFQEVKKVGVAGLSAGDCQVGVIKTPQESLIEWRKHRGKKRQRGQRIGETEVGVGGQWAFWWGLSEEHMWVTAWINTLSLLCVDDLHAEKFFLLFRFSNVPFTHRLLHSTLKETRESRDRDRDRAALSHSTSLWM